MNLKTTQIRCTNSKNFRISVNKIYNVENETEDKYEIINDLNLLQQYSKSLFQIVKQEEEKFDINKLKLHQKNTDLSLIYNEGKIFTLKNIFDNFSYTQSPISCAILEIYGINPFISSLLNNKVFDEFLTYNNLVKDKNIVTEAIFASTINTVMEEMDNTLFLLSTNIADENNKFNDAEEEEIPEVKAQLRYGIIDTVLSNYPSVLTHTTHNVKSSNNIKVWIINKSELDFSNAVVFDSVVYEEVILVE